MKIKVIKKNFAKKLQEAASDNVFFKMFSSELKGTLSNLPEEQEIYIDTKYIVEIDSILPEELSGGAFAVKLAIPSDGNPCIYIKNECFDELFKAWKSDDEPSGPRALNS